MSFDGDGKVTVESTDEKADIVLKGMSATRAFWPLAGSDFRLFNENRVNTLLKAGSAAADMVFNRGCIRIRAAVSKKKHRGKS